ncbi:class I SAM-dependent methyltransferase [Rickettsiales bacterium LUAb2]
MLINKLQNLIKQTGFIPIDQFMQIVLTDHLLGYYTTKSPIGKTGDFTTAPEISQLFGEMLGFYIIHNWQLLGSPSKLNLLEFGPGLGTLMFDILNLIKKIPALFEAIEVNLIEISDSLTKIQQEKLAPFKHKITWHKIFDHQNYKSSTIIIANEFLDALPTKQYKFINNNWHEVYITTINNKFEFILNKEHSIINHLLPDNFIPDNGMIFEYSPNSLNYTKNFAEIISQFGGAAAIIDYGYTNNTFQSTLQAMKDHQKANFLDDFGNNDLTSLVNFPILVNVLKQLNKNLLINLTSQRDFLLSSGIMERLKILLDIAENNEKDAIIKGVNYIINEQDMGCLFKVLTFSCIN